MATRLIARLLPPREREDTLGDLAERFYRHTNRRGRTMAGLWYWKQAIVFLLRVPGERIGQRLRMAAREIMTPGGPRRIGPIAALALVMQDVRYAFRSVRNNLAFTSIAVITLALGVGATTAVFSVLHGVVLTPLPYHEPDQLVRMYRSHVNNRDQRQFMPGLDFLDFREQVDSFDGLAALYTYAEIGLDVTGLGGARRLRALPVSAGYFEVYRATPLLGRTFGSEEEDTPRRNAPFAVLSHRTWTTLTDSDPDIVGSSLTLDGEAHTVLGVMRPSFHDVVAGDIDVWVPAGMQRGGQNSRGNHYLTIVGRLKPDVSLAQAQAEVDAVQAAILEQLSGDWENTRVTLYPLFDDVVGPTGIMLFVLMGAAGLVLLIACVNVANLFLARSIARQKEIAVRAALGSGRLRLAGQLLVESLVIAAIGGAAGLAATFVGVRVLLAVSPESLARAEEVSFDPTLLGFTAAMTILTGLVFGVAPAWQALKVDLNHILRDAGRGSTAGLHGKHLRGALVSGQMSLAVVLLVGAGLLIKSFVGLQQLELGVNPENVATFAVNLPSARYSDAEQRIRFHQSIQDRLRTVSGVRAAGAISKLPVSGEYHSWGYQWNAPDGMSEWNSIQVRVVEGDYFDALGIGLIEGRGFESGDRLDTPSAALLNRAAAEFAFSGREAVGEQISVNGHPWTVVGVVEDVAHDHRGSFARKVYLPHSQYGDDNRNWALTQVVQTESPRPDLWDLAKVELAAIDPDLVLHNPELMTTVMAREIARDRFALTLMGVFAAVAVALAAIGVYGVLSYLVSQRTPEIGIRMALGARASQVRSIVLGQAAVLTGIGIGVGLAGAFGLSRLLNTMVFGVSVTDPVIFGSVAVGLGVIAIVAGYVPARRATRVDPMQALRNE